MLLIIYALGNVKAMYYNDRAHNCGIRTIMFKLLHFVQLYSPVNVNCWVEKKAGSKICYNSIKRPCPGQNWWLQGYNQAAKIYWHYFGGKIIE